MLISAIVLMALLAGVFGLILGIAHARLRRQGDPVAEQIDALLPQTQCGQCGYPGCKPYANAIAKGEADINRCPPGGEATVLALADLLGREATPLQGTPQEKALAMIDEPRCIGCTLCIQACPVDAIMGAPRQIHAVIAPLCTGCALCIAPCPVSCIEMVPVVPTLEAWGWPTPDQASERGGR